MPNETRRKLLGEKLQAIDAIGIAAWLVYEVLRDKTEFHITDWKPRTGSDMPEGTPVLASLVPGEFGTVLGDDEVEAAIRTLWSEGWIYDYAAHFGVSVVIGATLDGSTKYAVDDVIASEPVEVEDRVEVKLTPDRNRLQRFEKTKAAALEKTDTKRQSNKVKRERKSLGKTAAKVGRTGASAHTRAKWTDDDNPYGVTMNKPGLWKLFEEKFMGIYGYSPKLYRSGKPAKPAFKLASIVDDYTIDVAMEAVVYMLDNWEELQELTGNAKPPMPSVVWNLRHEICHPLTQGEDPIEVIRKVKNKNRGRVRKEALNRGEWDEDAESKVGEWE